jgi:hypothetical protein|tara:strand:- start:1490 stop:1864 length:375 start_codon:yes stop_codon:yes gene_type:complete
MAAQVLSGSGNVTYTNTTGQNVRIVLNYVNVLSGSGDGTMSFQGVTVALTAGTSYGKTLALRDNFGGGTGVSATQTMAAQTGGTATRTAVPLEIAIAAGETFAITHTDSTRIDGYNCIIIPEAG